jgi:hypothetical protein
MNIGKILNFGYKAFTRTSVTKPKMITTAAMLKKPFALFETTGVSETSRVYWTTTANITRN